jgi:hypothetical protein
MLPAIFFEALICFWEKLPRQPRIDRHCVRKFSRSQTKSCTVACHKHSGIFRPPSTSILPNNVKKAWKTMIGGGKWVRTLCSEGDNKM